MAKNETETDAAGKGEPTKRTEQLVPRGRAFERR